MREHKRSGRGRGIVPSGALAVLALVVTALACSGDGGSPRSADGGTCSGGRCDGGEDGRVDASSRHDGAKKPGHDAGKHDAKAAEGGKPGKDAGPNVETLDPTVVTNLATSSKFLYSGPDPIQTGVKAGTIDVTQVSVVRGQVSVHSDAPSAVDGLAPIAGVTVTVLGHPEFGQTKTQSDGWFSMAVNGGGQITVDLQATGYLEVQRHVTTRWLEYAITQPVVLTVPEPGTSVTLSASSTAFQVVRGKTHGTAASMTPAEDADGARTATILIPPGTTASIDGLNEVATTMRATEFTTGSAGPAAMPGDLPPTSAYTYAVDLSIDEARGQTVTFSQPVLFYLDNFLALPAGDGTNPTSVPWGYYDTASGAWLGAPSGEVVKVLTVSGGTVTLDVTGQGNDTPDSLFTPPLVAGERAEIANLYKAGQSFWRVAVPHFCPWDGNLAKGLPKKAYRGPIPFPTFNNPTDDPCKNKGSIIECENQILAEEFPVAGTPFGLRYQTDRSVGGQSGKVTLTIPITGPTALPSVVTGIETIIEVAGRQQTYHTTSLAPNQSVTWTWDRKDAWQRTVSGHADVEVQVGYEYQATSQYQKTSKFGDFGSGVIVTGNRQAGTLTVWQSSTIPLNLLDAATTFGLGGLSLTAQDLYDPFGQTFYGGDGTRQTVDGRHFTTITTYAGADAPTTVPISASVPATSLGIAPLHMAMAPNGTLYAGTEGSSLVAIDPKARTMKTVTNYYTYGVTVGSDGIVYTTAGLTGQVSSFDPKSGAFNEVTDAFGIANFTYTGGIAMGPSGALYYAVQDVGGGGGTVETVYPSGQGQRTYASGFTEPQGIAVAPDGSVYVTDQGAFDVVKIFPDGRQAVVAGVPGQAGSAGSSNGDGGPAMNAKLCAPTGIALADDGSFYIADFGCSTLRFVDASGFISSVTSPFGSPMTVQGDNGPAGAAGLNGAFDVVLAPRGGAGRALYVGDGGHNRIRLISPPLPGFSLQDSFVPSADGSVVYEFDEDGRHQHTYDALRGQTLETLSYDPQGFLASLTDNTGNATTIDRSEAGKVIIKAPFGQKTTLTLDASGYVTAVENPNQETVGFTYETTGGNENGLLETLTDPKGQVHAFTYSADGLLTEDDNPAGGQRKLVRSNETTSGWTVTHTTRMGYQSQFVVQNKVGGGWERDVTDPTGATSSESQAADGSTTSTVNGLDGQPLVTTVTQQGPDPRYAMLSPITASSTTTLGPSKLTMKTSHTRTASTGTDFFDLKTQTDVVTLNPGSGAQTLTAVYTAGTPNNTLVASTTLGRTVTTTLDGNDRVVGVAIPGIAPTSITYNTSPCPGGGEGCGGRVTSVTATSPTDGTRTWKTHYAYSPDTGFASSAVDALGQTVSWTRDPVGRPLQTQLPTLASTSATENRVTAAYDPNGNLTSLAVPSSLTPPPTHAFLSYSAVDDLETYAPPALSPALATSNTTYAYNYDEQLTSANVPEGSGYKSVALGYDPKGRLSTVTDALSGVTATLAYAPNGLPASVSTGDGEVVSYGFGVDGPLMMSQTWSGAVAGSVSYTHDSFFRVASRTVNGGTALQYLFDADGLYAGSSGLVSYSITRDWNGKNGLLTGSSLGSISDALTYDGFGALASYTAAYKSAPIYASTISSRDANGRITAASETLSGKSHTWAFSYNEHGDLSSVAEDGTTTAYVFDPNGNRLSAGGQASTYDAQDRLLTSPGATYSYTNNGDLLTKVTSAGTTTYAYDLQGALRNVALPNGDTVSYVIDGQSRRVGRTWTHGSKKVTQGFLYDDQLHVAAELDGTGKVVSTFVYGTRFNVPDAMVRGGKIYRILSDWRGSVRAVVDTATGVVVESIDYDGWGNATVVDATCAAGAVCAPLQPFSFAGGITDRETGLVRFGARDYDPNVGRWTQKDGAGFGGGRNFYVYAWNDPIDFIDMTGYWVVVVSGQVGASFGPGVAYSGGVWFNGGAHGWLADSDVTASALPAASMSMLVTYYSGTAEEYLNANGFELDLGPFSLGFLMGENGGQRGWGISCGYPSPFLGGGTLLGDGFNFQVNLDQGDLEEKGYISLPMKQGSTISSGGASSVLDTVVQAIRSPSQGPAGP